jgi:hypothetical protein
MSRAVVTAAHAERGVASILLDADIHAHLSTEHSAQQFIGVGGDHAP